MCISAFNRMKDCVLWPAVTERGHENPKMVKTVSGKNRCWGGWYRCPTWTFVFPLYFPIVKWRVGSHLNNQRGRLENRWQSRPWNKLEKWMQRPQQAQVVCEAVPVWTVHSSSFTTQSKIVSTCLQKTVLPWKHRVSVQMAQLILSLCCMQMMCLVKLFSICTHVHFMCGTLTCDPGPGAFLLLDVSLWMPVLPFVYEAASRQPDESANVTQSEEANINACLYFSILYKP